ncbi:hypothetical protein N657DRAFT_244972 [Parathielavia appendiculata]|uniref:Protein kinase domain-containing protein n=1 Tax=Parathielavia appendiculata TaxID=2587402 RepID=A0AAN6Z0X9_9PEZI|nr:hypothetical protein N657DRAFT_244972 [Parathielavia appendiculata]
MEDNENIEIKDIQFGFRRFQAPAKRIYANRHVFLLDVPPNPIASWVSSWTPQLLRSWLERLLPEWFLPATVVLKERKPEKAEEYENEIDTYQRLYPLQGQYIPRMFGEVASYNPSKTRYRISKRPTPAILLEKVEGDSLHSLPPEELGDPLLLDQLQDMYRLLTENGVVHGDAKLHNFLRDRMGKRIVAIDFELSHPLPDDVTNDNELETLIIEIEQRRDAQSIGPAPGFSTCSKSNLPSKDQLRPVQFTPGRRTEPTNFAEWWARLASVPSSAS